MCERRIAAGAGRSGVVVVVRLDGRRGDESTLSGAVLLERAIRGEVEAPAGPDLDPRFGAWAGAARSRSVRVWRETARTSGFGVTASEVAGEFARPRASETGASIDGVAAADMRRDAVGVGESGWFDGEDSIAALGAAERERPEIEAVVLGVICGPDSVADRRRNSGRC